MKIRTMAKMSVMAVLAAGAVAARNVEPPVRAVETICAERVANNTLMFQAKWMASGMFATAGVSVAWQAWEQCPADGIRISLSQRSRPSDHPGAMAYTLPFEGIHIIIFLDRIVGLADERVLPHLVAHVMVHEVTHILEGVDRHSRTGIMKAQFTAQDIAEMEYHPLPFVSEDLLLIRLGIEQRRARVIAGNFGRSDPQVAEQKQ